MTIEWKTFGEGWRRAASSIADYRWYVVSDGECALALEVSSGRYPATVVREQNSPSHGSDLSLHVPWPAGDDAEEDIRLGHKGYACDVVEPGFCWIPFTTALGAGEFWKLHGVDSFEQPESFWEALRAKAIELISAARAKHAAIEHLQQCPTCLGRGLVDKGQKT